MSDKKIISNCPNHIGIIMDGNRRFAKRLMLQPWKGHEFGAEKIEKVLDWSIELGIVELTLYAFSIENFNRPKTEFDFLMEIFRKELDRLIKDDRPKKQGIRIKFIGRINMFPDDIKIRMENLMEKTQNNSNYFINFAMAYGGRAEMIDAIKKIAEKVKLGQIEPSSVDEKLVRDNLYLQSDPDLIIRTSGEKRISGFLLWQGSYAEYYFLDKMWPEFEKEDLVNAIEEYALRKRRFGK